MLLLRFYKEKRRPAQSPAPVIRARLDESKWAYLTILWVRQQDGIDHMHDAVRREDVGNSHAGIVEAWRCRGATVERDRTNPNLDSVA